MRKMPVEAPNDLDRLFRGFTLAPVFPHRSQNSLTPFFSNFPLLCVVSTNTRITSLERICKS